jgi:hypothetical protein
MSELTGLDSILEKSHYKTERKHKYSFGKSNRFPQLKSTYHIQHSATPSTSTTNPHPEIPALAASATAENTSLIKFPTIPAHPPTTCPGKKR